MHRESLGPAHESTPLSPHLTRPPRSTPQQAPVHARESSRERADDSLIWRILLALLLGALALLIILTFRDYGVSYDEAWHATYGDYILRWYSSGFQDRRALDYWMLVYYGGFASLLLRLATAISPLAEYETRHLATVLFALAAVGATARVGRRLGGGAVGFLAALFLALTPRFYGHAFFNAVDIPFAALTIISVAVLLRVVAGLPHAPWRHLAALGVAVGLALGVRVAGVLLVGEVGLAFALWLLLRWRAQPRPPLWSLLRAIAPRLALVYTVAYATMLAFWPAAQVSPLRHPWRALRLTTAFPSAFEIYFDGRMISTADLPWHYLPTWFLITLPEFFLAGLAAGALLGAVAVARALWARRLGALVAVEQPLLIVAFAALFPLGYTIATRPVEYDEIRHFLFVLPLLALLAARAVVALAARLRRWPAAQVAGGGLLLLALLATAREMVALHPYQYIYFNRLFGQGAGVASQRFETDYWGLSLREGVAWLVANVPATNPRSKVASCLHANSTATFLPPDRFDYVGSYHDGQPVTATPDYFLASPRWGCDRLLQGEVIHTVTRQGARLLTIIRVTDPAAGHPREHPSP